MAQDQEISSAVRDTAGTTRDRRSSEIRDAARELSNTTRQTGTAASGIAESVGRTAAQAGEVARDQTARVVGAAADQSQRMADEAGKAAGLLRDRAGKGLEVLIAAQGSAVETAQAVLQEWASYGQDSVGRWGEQMRRLMDVRTIQDLVGIQGEILRAELECLLRTNQKIAELTTRKVQDIAGRVNTAATQRTESPSN